MSDRSNPIVWTPLAEWERAWWAKNREALIEHQPDLPARIEAQFDRRDVLIGRSPDGLYFCRYRRNEREFCVFGDRPADEEVKALGEPIARGFHDGKWIAVTLGCGMGVFIPAVVNYLSQHHTGEPKGLLVMEQDPALLAAALSFYDYSRAISTGRVLFIAGPNLEQEAERIWRVHHLETLDAGQIGVYPGYRIRDPERLKDYQHAHQSLLTLHEENRSAYFGLLRHCETYWSTPKTSIQRVWTHVTDDRGAGSVLLGLIDGFSEAGLESRALRLKDRLFTRFHRSAYDFFEFHPDLILCANHSSNYVSSFAHQAPIPRLVWYVDHPRNTVEYAYHDRDLLLLAAENFRAEAQSRGGRVLGVLPVGAWGEMTPPPLQPEWRHDVSYVGSVIDSAKILSGLSPSDRDWVEAIVAAQLAEPMLDLNEMIARNPAPHGAAFRLMEIIKPLQPKTRYMTDKQAISYFLYGEANTRRRLQYILSIGEERGLGLYGPDDWLRLLPERLQPHYHGSIDSADDLTRLYQESRVNLSINALQGFGFLNPRVFEVPSAGGFLAAEWSPGLEDAFDGEKELSWFKNEEELNALIDRALSDEGGRMAMVSRARKRIQAEHTYAHRAKAILRMMEEK
ncbi:MAG: glycosyltransferase [bacterium]|nr:glycosyltransferase [bacterium]